jgi:hypothetical protein
MTCGDVYTLAAPPVCGDVWAFPSQVHPTPPSGGGGIGGRPGQLRTYDRVEVKPRRIGWDDDEALAILLIELLRG